MIVSFAPDLAIWSIAPWTSISDLGSSAEVASSKMSILGFLIRALAIAILCFGHLTYSLCRRYQQMYQGHSLAPRQMKH